MPGTTPVYGFPYPEPTDLVADYPALGQDLAEDIEAVLPTLGGLGFVSYSALSSSAVNFNNVFTSDYKHYRIIIRATLSGSESLFFRMRSSGTNDTGSVYIFQSNEGASSSATAATGTQTQGYFMAGSGSTNYAVSVDVYAPQQAQNTWLTATYRSASPNAGIMATVVNTTTSYDGISLYPGGAATFTSGTCAIYGYRES